MKKDTLTYVLTPSVQILPILNGRPLQAVQATDLRFAKAVEYCTDNKVDELEKLLTAVNDITVAAASFESGSKLSVKGDKVFYNGNYEITGALATTLIEMAKQGFKDISRFEKFVEKLLKNPSASSTQEFFDFMSYKNLPITEDGNILAYKSVDADWWSHHGNPATVVLSGEVGNGGRIANPVGAVIEVARNQVNDDRNIGCSYGLHAGSWDYANNFGNGRMLLVEIDPVDVVSVPTDCNCQKVRVCKYKVLQEVAAELLIATVNTKSGDLAENQLTDRQIAINEVSDYLDDRGANGKKSATLKKIKKSIKCKLSCSELLNIVATLDLEVLHESKVSKSKVILDYGFENEDGDFYR